MAVDLENYVPQYIGVDTNDGAGKEITSEYWNLLWKKYRTQGDYNSETLYELIKKLNDTIYNAVDGGLSITKQALDDGTVVSGTSISEQIDYIFQRLLPLYIIGNTDGAEYLHNENFVTPDDCPEPLLTVAQQIEYLYDGLRVLYDTFPYEHGDLPGRDLADAHPISAITGLEERLRTVIGGLAEAYPHNSFPGRNTENAHTIGSITGLDAALDVLNNHLTESVSIVHNAAVIRGRDSTGAWRDLQTLLNNIYVLLKAATGFSQLNHNDLIGRNASAAHNIAAIDGLNSALDERYTKQQSDANYQQKIIYGTDAPSGTYPDGTIYFRIR